MSRVRTRVRAAEAKGSSQESNIVSDIALDIAFVRVTPRLHPESSLPTEMLQWAGVGARVGVRV